MNNRDMHGKRAIVVGASSGIGEALARLLAAKGAAVVVIARREDRLKALVEEMGAAPGAPPAYYFVHDVRETYRAASLLQEAALSLGGLDLVIYAAGIMPAVPANQYPTVVDMDTLATNLNGAVAWLNAAADRFTRARTGTIIGISSVAGDRGRSGNPVYGAGKSALNTYLASLRNRLARHGVTVLTVKPGFVRTPLLAGLKLPESLVSDPGVVAEQILTAAANRRRVVYVPGWWRWIMTVIRLIPAPIMERLNI